MQQEIKSIVDNNVWNLVNLPNDQTSITVNGYLKRKLLLMVLCLVIRLDLLLKVSHRNMVLITMKHLHLLLDLNRLEHYCL